MLTSPLLLQVQCGTLVAAPSQAVALSAVYLVPRALWPGQNRHMHAKFRSCVLQDIAAEFWVGAQRSRKQRLITVGKHQVLRENNYDLASVRLLSLMPAPALFADSSSCGVLRAASRSVPQHGQSGQAACVLVRSTSVCASMSTELSGTVCCAGGAQRVRLGDGARRRGGARRPPHQPPDRGY